MFYEISKLNKVQLCMEHLHLGKQHQLERANIPDTVNNSIQLHVCFRFAYFEMSYTNKILINK